jgi:outer membrane protein assembly factor BamA
LFHAGLVPTHKMAYHTSLVSRTDDAGIQNRLTLGSISTLRGYGIGGVDLRTNANASFLLSGEYRFPIRDLSFFAAFIPSWITGPARSFGLDLGNISPRLDGAFFVDYGRVGRWFEDIVSYRQPGYISGVDFGFGLRIMEPSMRISGCLDVVWVEKTYTAGLDFVPVPWAELYLNLPF